MSEYKVTISWKRSGPDFVKANTRGNTPGFDEGDDLRRHRLRTVVPAPWSNPKAVDPEEAFVASFQTVTC